MPESGDIPAEIDDDYNYWKVERNDETWIYGFHFKNSLVLRKAQELGMRILNDGGASAMLATMRTHIERGCQGLKPEYEQVLHSDGQAAKILGLVVIEGHLTEEERHRIEETVDSNDLETLRKELGCEEGTKAKWYEINDIYKENDAVISDDESTQEAVTRVLKVKSG